jgi:hypothetical protein
MRSLEEIRQLVAEKSVGEIMRRGKGGGASLSELQLLASATGVAVYQNKENLAISLKRKISGVTTPHVLAPRPPAVASPTAVTSSSAAVATVLSSATSSSTPSATPVAANSSSSTAPRASTAPALQDLAAAAAVDSSRDEVEEVAPVASKKRKSTLPKESSLVEVLAEAISKDPVQQASEGLRRAASDYLLEREMTEVVNRIEVLHNNLKDASDDHPVRSIWEAELRRYMQKYNHLSKVLANPAAHPQYLLPSAAGSSPDSWSRMQRIRNAYQAFVSATTESYV